MTGDEQVLTFTLGTESYCLGIEYVDEIVDAGELTNVPDTSPHVEGVMNLRGQTTQIVDPGVVLDGRDERSAGPVTDGGTTQRRVIVLDESAYDADGRTGWMVDDVEEVVKVADRSVETDGIADTDLVQGLVEDDGNYTVWLGPSELAV